MQKDSNSGNSNARTKNLFSIKNQANRRRDLASPVSEVLGITAVSVVLYYGGRLVLNNNFSLNGGAFLTYITIFTQIINPLKALSTASYNIQKGAASIERINKLIHENPPSRKLQIRFRFQRFNDCIEFRGVNFQLRRSCHSEKYSTFC